MMLKFPFYKQHDEMDCGASCLRIVISYYLKTNSLSSIDDSVSGSKIGTSLRGILEASREFGFNAQWLKMPIEELIQINRLPVILYWDSNHYCVLYKIKGSQGREAFYISDPRAGRLCYTREQFLHHWIMDQDGGIAMTLKPTKKLFSNETVQKRKSFWHVFSYIFPYKRYLLQIALGFILGGFLQLIIPFLSQMVVDKGIEKKDLQFIYLLLIAQLSLTTGGAIVDLIRGWVTMHLGTKVNITLVSEFLLKLFRLPISFFDSRRTGDIIQRILDHHRIENFLTTSLLNVLFAFFSIVILGVVIYLYNWRVFLIYSFGSCIYVLWVLLFAKKRAKIDNQYFALQSENQSNIIELISAMPDIKLNLCGTQKMRVWSAIQSNLYDLKISSLSLAQSQETGGMLINQIKNLVITAFVAALVVENALTLGMMISIQYIIGQLNSPINQIVVFIRQIQDARLSYERLAEIHRKKDEIVDPFCLETPDIQESSLIQIKNVSFSYDKNSSSSTLKNLTLDIPIGKTTAIVGESGSGKTTLLKLLLGFYSPNHGTILLGEQEMQKVNISEWRKLCGVVMQDGYIYNDTIAGNIAPHEQYPNEERLAYATKIANIDSFIERLPLKYNMRIGREGLGLSQGQKQRILIARAVYKDPLFIFLDEATNALDANNERSILENLHSFFKSRTSIIVAHRLSTVKNADQIIVMDNGCIVERGLHEELIAQRGKYYMLVKNQINI